MSTEESRTGGGGGGGGADGRTGALLLCRAEQGTVAPAARLLRSRMVLAGAGDGWSVLVPEGRPWSRDGEPVEGVLVGWASALGVGAPWPVLALWWDADRAGCALASGFRRPVGYVWLADGTPAGEEDAMEAFAARLGLDPVLDVQSLDRLTRRDPAADARARLLGVLAVLTRAGADVPPGLAPGTGARVLCDTALALPGAERIEWPGWREAVRPPASADSSRLGPWMPWAGGPRARTLALAQVAAGVPLAGWGMRRRGGWAAAGALLVAHGALGLAYDYARTRT
ncbi:hypothetical protein ACIQU5_01525 [Streptomyces sp. NPDC090306]|uniref:hypothetical protein n=1 Tax=Streptomyces sp. NPDC090306 TaxID=3365961 RepID=UPI00382E0FA8